MIGQGRCDDDVSLFFYPGSQVVGKHAIVVQPQVRPVLLGGCTEWYQYQRIGVEFLFGLQPGEIGQIHDFEPDVSLHYRRVCVACGVKSFRFAAV